VQKPGSSRVSSHHNTQAQAIDRAREIVGNSEGGEVVIHGRGGRVRDSDTVAPGNDPNRREIDADMCPFLARFGRGPLDASAVLKGDAA
jgi:hypothetical protein